MFYEDVCRWQRLIPSICLACSLVFTANDCVSSAADAPVFRAGFSERDITPKIGMEQPGGYGKSFHRSIHDACKVRASVFDDGNNVVAIVGIDALLIRRSSVEVARKAITERCGIPGNSVMISASHSHSAGPTGMILPGEFDSSSDLVKTLAYEKSSMADSLYLQQVERAIADAVVEAHSRRVESRCAAGYGHEDKAAFNRRFFMKSGFTMTHPGQGNPEIIEPAGPNDPHVGVIGAWNVEGKCIGCVVNYACHATTGPGGISADYIYYLEKTIRGLMGDEVIVVFLPGMTGDITQVDNRSPYQIKQFGEISARYVGGRIGAEALRVLLALEQTAGPLAPVAARQELLSFPRRVPRPERLAKSLELVSKDPKTVDATEWTFAKEIVLLDAIIALRPKSEVEIQAIQVGPVVLLSCPAEYFVEFGLQMRTDSPFPFTFPVSLANDCIGYVPTEEAMGPRGGGYETRLTSYSNLIPSAGTEIAKSLVRLSKSLTPGAVPKPALIPPFNSKPWAYGNLPPEVD